MSDKAIVRHTLTMYEALNEASNEEKLPGGSLRIFRGKVTDVFRSTGIGQSYYSEIFRQLNLQNCVTFLQRGSKSVESVVILHGAPTSEGYRPPQTSPLTDPERYANLSEDVEALKILVGGVHIAEALIEVEKRFKKLEDEVHSRKNSVTSTTAQ